MATTKYYVLNWKHMSLIKGQNNGQKALHSSNFFSPVSASPFIIRYVACTARPYYYALNRVIKLAQKSMQLTLKILSNQYPW